MNEKLLYNVVATVYFVIFKGIIAENLNESNAH